MKAQSSLLIIVMPIQKRSMTMLGQVGKDMEVHLGSDVGEPPVRNGFGIAELRRA